ncbi:MAG: PIN domain-containing protein [Candidatus Anammoxibacter sp.]
METADVEKTKVAKSVIIENDVFVTAQIINETCVNLLKKAQFSEKDIRSLISSFYQKYTVLEISEGILFHASKLRSRYKFSFWDSIVVASASDSGSSYLYSEDMQNGLTIEKRLKIINPFKK